MINPTHDLFRWGPIPGKPIYTSYFMHSLTYSFPKVYGYPWPEIIFYFQQEKMTFICEYAPLRECGENVFRRWILDDTEFERIKKFYATAVSKLHLEHQKIQTLQKLSDQQLLKTYQDWQRAYLHFWDHGLVPETANWGGEKILKEKLGSILQEQTDFIRAFEKLSAPTQLSFYVEEEVELARLKLQEKSPEFQKLLQRHAQKYFWINNSYFETHVLDAAYFENKLRDITSNQAREKIQTILKHSQKTKQEKAAMITEFKLNKETQKIVERLSYCIYWQDARKKDIFIANYYIRLFAEEISRRKKTPITDVENYWCGELEQLLLGKSLSAKELQQRSITSAGYYTHNLKVVVGKNADELIKPFLEKKVDKNMREFKGTVASIGKGIVRGKVKVLLHPKEWEKLRQGDILVAPMTSPEYILAMRKAAAIITDEGGMTSHAAIVSRELGIPCIVGTNIATALLEDGEMVEVDARKGVIKKIKNLKN